MNIEIKPENLAELLTYASYGMAEEGEYTPEFAQLFKQLVEQLPEGTWNRTALMERAADYTQEEDYPLMEEDDDDYDY